MACKRSRVRIPVAPPRNHPAKETPDLQRRVFLLLITVLKSKVYTTYMSEHSPRPATESAELAAAHSGREHDEPSNYGPSGSRRELDVDRAHFVAAVTDRHEMALQRAREAVHTAAETSGDVDAALDAQADLERQTEGYRDSMEHAYDNHNGWLDQNGNAVTIAPGPPPPGAIPHPNWTEGTTVDVRDQLLHAQGDNDARADLMKDVVAHIDFDDHPKSEAAKRYIRQSMLAGGLMYDMLQDPSQVKALRSGWGLHEKRGEEYAITAIALAGFDDVQRAAKQREKGKLDEADESLTWARRRMSLASYAVHHPGGSPSVQDAVRRRGRLGRLMDRVLPIAGLGTAEQYKARS